jgi:hypothetical protein
MAVFRQRDVTRAVKGVEASGHKVARVEIDRAGKIIVILAQGANDATQRANPWDSLLENPA